MSDKMKTIIAETVKATIKEIMVQTDRKMF